MKKLWQLVGIAAATAVVIVAGVLLLSDTRNASQPRTNIKHTDKVGGFTATARYQGNNQWEYHAEGQLPNPCYEYEASVQVRESSPEQVVLRVLVMPPEKGRMCIQQLQPVTVDGDYQASAEATFSLQVEKR